MPPPSQPQPSPGPPPASLPQDSPRMFPGSHLKCFANGQNQAGSASPHQCKPCPVRLRGTATLGCALFLPSPHLSQPPPPNPDASVSPGKPPPHTAKTCYWPPLLSDNY